MGNVIAELIPFIIGAAVVPLYIIIVLLVLRGEGGVAKAAAVVAGMFVLRLVQGVVFGYVLSGTASGNDSGGPSRVVSTLLIVLGILLYTTAFRTWQKEEDVDAPPPKWMTMFQDITLPKAFGMGMLMIVIGAKQWVFTLGALGVIRRSDLDGPENIIAYLIFMLGAMSLLLLPIILRLAAPKQSTAVLESASAWLEKNNRPIVIAVSLIFGTFFVYRGVSGFLG
jgi:hypothetical protein